jgi:hypothetical protein
MPTYGEGWGFANRPPRAKDYGQLDWADVLAWLRARWAWRRAGRRRRRHGI